MPYNKGDFTQQGVAGDVSALVRLNEKRVMKVVLSSDDESDNCDISGAVTDLLNNEVYPIGAGVSGNIEITENGENINVAPYATATVNVAGGGGTPTEVVYISGTFTPVYSAEAQAYIVIIETPAVIAQPMNDLFVLTVGNKTENVIIAPDTDQIPGAILPLEPESPDYSFSGVMPLAIGSSTAIIAPDSNPVFIELKQVIGVLDINITSDQSGAPLLKIDSNGSGGTWDRTTAVYQSDFENHISIPYCGVKRAYIVITSSFTYQNAVNCRVDDFSTYKVIVIYDNNASIDLSFDE